MSRRAPRRTIKSYNRDKYSMEHRRTEIGVGAELVGASGLYQGGQIIVPPSGTQGMRKVKHVTVSLSKKAVGVANNGPFFWALVFVPDGYTANPLGNPSSSLYEPNQFVMSCGIIDPEAGPIRIRSPISRNLNSGDAISLIIGSLEAQATYAGVVSYAITLQ